MFLAITTSKREAEAMNKLYYASEKDQTKQGLGALPCENVLQAKKGNTVLSDSHRCEADRGWVITLREAVDRVDKLGGGGSTAHPV